MDNLPLTDILLDVPNNEDVPAYVGERFVTNLQELEAFKNISEGNRRDVETKALGYSSAKCFISERHPDKIRPIFTTFKFTLSNIQQERMECIQGIMEKYRKEEKEGKN